MCRNNDHGGRRCPHDTSAHRQARRVAERERKKVIQKRLANGKADTFEPVAYSNLEGIKTAAAELKAFAYSAPANGMSQKEHDAVVEQRITSLGKTLAARAESISGIRLNELPQKLQELEDKIYAPFRNEDGVPLIDEAYEAQTEAAIAYSADRNIENLERKVAATKRVEEIRIPLNNAYIEFDEQANLLKQSYRHKLRDAYRKVLAEIRVLGGEIGHNGDLSDEEAAKLVQETAGSVYPKEWIELHNSQSSEAQVYKYTNVRPQYVEMFEIEDQDDGVIKTAPDFGYTFSGNQADIEKLITAFPTTGKEAATEYAVSSLPYSSDVRNITGFSGMYEQQEFYKQEGDASLTDEQLKAEGWVFSTSVGVLTEPLPELPLIDEEGRYSFENAKKNLETPRWHRVLKTTKVVKPVTFLFKENTPVTKNQTETEDTTDYVKGVAIHEFGHRMEQVLPGRILGRQQKAFLMRRANKTEANEYSDMRIINNSEFGHDIKGLVSTYTGREYFNDKNYEVFTTGVEAMFGGDTYGGLVGASKEKADFEHRGFVLGAMAVL